MGAGVPRVPPEEATAPSGHVGLWPGQPGPLGGTGGEKLAVQVSPGRQRRLSLEGHPCRPPLGPDRPLCVGSRGSEAPLWRPGVACGAGELLGVQSPGSASVCWSPDVGMAALSWNPKGGRGRALQERGLALVSPGGRV